MPRSPSKRGKVQADVPSEDVTTKSQHKIAFMENSLFASTSIEVVKLRNPNTDQGSMYIVDKQQKTLHEIKAFDEGNRCWFLGQTIESNGKLHIISPVDVTYLILPYLMKSPKVVPLDHLLEDDDYPDVLCLELVVADKDLSHIADRAGSADLCAWRYNESSTLTWLERRVAQLATLLQEKKVPTTLAQSLTFVRPMDPQEAKEAYTGLAHGIISEYLSDNLSKKLHKHLKLPDHKVKPKVSEGSENKPPKKQKVEGPTDDYTKDNIAPKAKTVMSTKEKALAKSAAGSKNIMSFFAKK